LLLFKFLTISCQWRTCRVTVGKYVKMLALGQNL